MLIQSRIKYYLKSFIINWKKNIVGSALTTQSNHNYFTGKGFITNWRRNFRISTGTSYPTVTTQSISGRTETSIIGNGTITDIGIGDVTVRGFVYGTTSKDNPGNTSPELSGYDNNISDSGTFGTGAFTKSITGLTKGQIYYYRAFAQNTDGYGYGNEIQFQTFNKIYTNKTNIYSKKPNTYSTKNNVYSKKINN